MPRNLRIAFLLLIPSLAAAAIWPDTLGDFRRVSANPVAVRSDQAIWDEYGFREGETAQYEGGGQKFTATAWRFQDPTGALGAFWWLRSSDSNPSALARLAADTSDGSLL